MKHTMKKLTALLLALVMVLSLTTVTTVAGTSGVTYLDENGDQQTLTGSYTTVENSDKAVKFATGWYVVSGDATISKLITADGDVNLILCDGATLTASAGIAVPSGKSLTIYAQSIGDSAGALIATGANSYSGIGGSKSGNVGTITINGGSITATGGSGGAGIGGNGSTIVINSGVVNATGGAGDATWVGAGIGASEKNKGHSVTINGGTVTAAGGKQSAGIGGAGNTGVAGTISITGGTIVAVGGSDGAGIGSGFYPHKDNTGSVSITGGTVTAIAGANAAHNIVSPTEAIGKGSVNSKDERTVSVTLGEGVTVLAGASATDNNKVDDFETNHAYAWAQTTKPEKLAIHPTLTLQDWTYGSAANTPVLADNPSDGAVTYTYKAKGANDSTYAAATPTDAGTYVVKATVAETKDYEAGEATAEFTINKAALTVTADAKTKKYDEADPELTYTAEGFITGEDAAVLTGALSRATGTDVGTYAIEQGTLSAKNYTITFVGANLTITQANIGPTVTLDDWTYGEDANTPTLADDPSDGAVTYQYKVKGTDNTHYTAATPTDAGEYVVKATVAEAKNYRGAVATDTFTIKKATLTLSLEGWTYGDQAKTPVLSGNVDNSAVTYTYKAKDADDSAYTAAVPTAAGDYIVKATVAENPNYANNTATASFTIAPATLTVTANAQTKTYGEDDPALTYTAQGWKFEDTEALLTGALTRATGTDAGTYAIGLGTLSAGGNYTITFVPANLTINPKALTVTAQPKTITFGDQPANDGVIYDGFITGEDASVLTGTLAYTYNYEQYGDVGQYTITPAGLTSGNYAITFNSGVLTVSPKALDGSALTVEPDRIRYKGKAVGPEITVKDGDITLVSGKDYDLSGDPTANDFGTWFFTVTLKGNYTGSFQSSFELYDEQGAHQEKDNVSASVYVKKDAMETQVNNMTVDLAKALLTADEAARNANGEPVSVYLEVESMVYDDLSDAAKTAVVKGARRVGSTAARYMDLTLWKKIGTDAAQQVADGAGNKLSVTVTIPKELRRVPAGYIRTFYIISGNGGETVAVSRFGDTITFETDKFSTYALAYHDSYVEVSVPVKSATTADAGMVLYATLIMSGLATAAFVTLKRKEEN